MMFTNPAQAGNAEAQRKLLRIRRQLLSALRVREFLTRYGGWTRKPDKKTKHWMALLLCLPLKIIASMREAQIRRNSEIEWQTKRTDPCGSEMYMVFDRNIGDSLI
jgi:hypothetical protein